MPRSTEGGSSGGKPTHAEHVLAWFNGLHRNEVPPQINHHRNGQGLISAQEFEKMPDNMRHRIIDAFKRRGAGVDPFPHYVGPADHQPQGGGGGNPGGGGGNPGGGGGGGNGGPAGGGHHNGGGGGGHRVGGINLREQMAAEYGWSLSFLNHHPELKGLFNRAVKGGWTPERFVAELRDTNWFKKTSASARQFEVNRITDPASFQSDLNKTAAHVHQVWGQMLGMPLDGDLAQKFAIRAMKFGWNDEQIANHLVGAVNFKKALRRDELGGSAAQAAMTMRQAANDYGVDPHVPWMAKRIERVLNGNDTMDGVINDLQSWSANKYEAFADQIRGGKTVSEIAAPYTQSMSQLLEMNPGQVKLNNNMIQKALTRRVDGKAHPMSLGDFEDMVRKDPRWMHTQQANDQFSQLAYNLGQSWGLI